MSFFNRAAEHFLSDNDILRVELLISTLLWLRVHQPEDTYELTQASQSAWDVLLGVWTSPPAMKSAHTRTALCQVDIKVPGPMSTNMGHL